jgi:hypothetical protein
VPAFVFERFFFFFFLDVLLLESRFWILGFGFSFLGVSWTFCSWILVLGVMSSFLE